MILFTLSLSIGLSHTAAEDPNKLSLPEGAKARFGKGYIFDCVYSPDGDRLAVASSIGIWIIDASTGEELDLLTGHTDYVRRVAFSPDGQTLVSGSYDKTVRLWDIVTSELKHTLMGHWDEVISIAFSPDGQTLASGSLDKTIILWDAMTGEHKHTLQGHTHFVESIAFSPDGQTLASGSADRTIRLWDAVTGENKHTLERHEGWVRSVAFSPDGQTLASGSGYPVAIMLWDAMTGEHKHTLQGKMGTVWSVAFSPDGLSLASGSSDGTIRLWDAVTGEYQLPLEGHTDEVWSVAFSPDGQTLVGGGGWRDNAIHLWDAVTGQHNNTLIEHTSRSVTFNPGGQTLVTNVSSDGTIRLWDAMTGEHKHTLTGHSKVNSIAFSPDGKILASGSDDKTIRLWDAVTGEHKHTLEGHTDWVGTVVFSLDGKTLASGGGDSTIRLWDAVTGEHKHTLIGNTDDVNSLSFSPDGQTLASGGWDSTIRLWDAITGEHKQILGWHSGWVNSVAFSPDGQTLASGGGGVLPDNTIYLFDLLTGEHKHLLEGHTDEVKSVAFSLDGQTLASGSYDKTIRLWDAVTGEHKQTLTGHTGRVGSIAFSLDGQTLVSGSNDGTVLLWDLTLYLDIAKEPTTDPEEPPVTIVPSRTGSDYLPDEWTLGLWHFDGENIADSSINAVQGVIEGNAQWSTNQDWHEDAKPGHSFSFDGNTLITLGHADVLIPTDAITVEAWVYPQDLSGWRLVGTNWDLPPGAYHLGVRSGYAQFQINTDRGEAFVIAEVPLELGKWSHLAGTYDSNLNQVKFYVNGVEVASMEHSGKLADNDFDVVIGSKNNRRYKWNGLIDEVRISSIARQPEELSPNLAIPTMTYLKEDVNRDGVVDIQDLMLVAADLTQMGEYVTDVNEDGAVNIADLVLVAGAQSSNTTAAVPALHHTKAYMLSRTDVEMWLAQAQQLNVTDPKLLRGIRFLEHLLLTITPEKTALLANYPNPFNPETWIPYQLAKPAKVNLTIYGANGQIVRQLALGHQQAGIYHNRSRAAYWDGKNGAGESVASGVYFYTLTAGDYSATRKMLILK